MPPDSARQLRPAARVSLPAYLFAIAFPLLVVVAHHDMLSRDYHLTRPLTYTGGDSIGILAGAKNLIDAAWSYHLPFVGAPGQADIYDFPQCDFLNVLLLKILAITTRNPVAAVTLFYLLSFPLCAVSALWVLGRIGISKCTAAVAAALYTLLPYHFYRGQSHLFLDNYALVPLTVLIAFELATGVTFDGSPSAVKRRYIAALIVFAAVCTGVYYGLFGAFLIAVGGLLGAARGRSWEPIKSAGFLAMIAVLALLFNLAPTMWYHVENGPNKDVGSRRLDEAEIFGLRLAYLLLPSDTHRLPALAAPAQAYDQQSSLKLESRSEALGFLGDAGFLVLLAVTCLAAAGRIPNIPAALPDALASPALTLGILASLNLACILLATSGAVGSLIAFFISPLLRSLDRISVVIAFLALAAVAILIDAFIVRPLQSHGRGAVALALLAALLIMSSLDEVPRPAVDQQQQWRDFDRDHAFVANIEKQLPSGSMIFQLPYVAYPEAGRVGAIVDYDPFRGYLHSTNLRWSYGAMRGRPQDKIDQDLAALAPADMIPKLRTIGFAGLWIDLNGYDPAERSSIQSAFAAATGSLPILSDDPNPRFLFFRIIP
jgi:phosphoglycerol transferase